MAEPHVVAALVRKRADLLHLDATLRLFDAEAETVQEAPGTAQRQSQSSYQNQSFKTCQPR